MACGAAGAGKWLLTDDDDHFSMNLSRIGTEAAAEGLTAPGVTFEVRSNSRSSTRFVHTE